MGPTVGRSLTYVFGCGTILASLVLEWVGAMAIRAGTVAGGGTLMLVGLLLAFAGVLALPPTRRRLRATFALDLSTRTTVLLSGSAVAVALFVLFVALIELLASG